MKTRFFYAGNAQDKWFCEIGDQVVDIIFHVASKSKWIQLANSAIYRLILLSGFTVTHRYCGGHDAAFYTGSAVDRKPS